MGSLGGTFTDAGDISRRRFSRDISRRKFSRDISSRRNF
jgi:hypothetical protein